MTTFIAVCLGLIVVELAVLIAAFTVALIKVRDAAQAVEIAAYRVDQEVSGFGDAMRSGWGAAFRTLISAGLQFFR